MTADLEEGMQAAEAALRNQGLPWCADAVRMGLEEIRKSRKSRTYRCVATQRIDAIDGTAFGRKDLVLPFVPFPGLGIFGLLDGEEAEAVKEVDYDPAEDVFWLRLSDDDASREDQGIHETMASAKAIYGGGWTWEDHPRKDTLPVARRRSSPPG